MIITELKNIKKNKVADVAIRSPADLTNPRLNIKSLVTLSSSLRCTSARVSSLLMASLDLLFRISRRLSYRLVQVLLGNLQIDRSCADWKNAATSQTTIWHSIKTLISTSSTSGSHKSTLNWSMMNVFAFSFVHSVRLGLFSNNVTYFIQPVNL